MEGWKVGRGKRNTMTWADWITATNAFFIAGICVIIWGVIAEKPSFAEKTRSLKRGGIPYNPGPVGGTSCPARSRNVMMTFQTGS